MPVIQIDGHNDHVKSRNDAEQYVFDRTLIAKTAQRLLDKYGYSAKAKGIEDHLEIVASSSDYGVQANHVNSALVKAIQGLNSLVLIGVHEKLTDPCMVVAHLLEILGEDG